MSLQTDSVFIEALATDSAVKSIVGDRVYGTAIPMPDPDADNVPVPYLIVTFDGMVNNPDSKDSGAFEGDEDTVTISVEVVADTLEGLHVLAQDARTAIRDYIAGDIDDDAPLDYSLSAGPVNYDSSKPCYWQTLTYQCTTSNL